MVNTKMSPQSIGLALAVAVCGAVYVVAHERRRRYKKLHPKPVPEPSADARQAGGDGGSAGMSQVVSVVEKDVLVTAMLETAEATYSLIEQTRRAVYILHKEKGHSMESAREMVQSDFQVNMQTVIDAVHAKHGVNDQMIGVSLKYYKDDERVREAYVIMTNALNGEAPPAQPAPTVVSTRGRGSKKRAGGR